MRQKLVPIEEDVNLKRDEFSGAVLNTDVRALEGYRAQRQRFKEMDKLKCDVRELKDDIGELKMLLKKVLDKDD